MDCRIAGLHQSCGERPGRADSGRSPDGDGPRDSPQVAVCDGLRVRCDPAGRSQRCPMGARLPMSVLSRNLLDEPFELFRS
jgi:hypothetical protein